MYKYFFSLGTIITLLHQALFAQWLEQPDLIPVYQNGKLMHHAWAGGLNSPQFSEIDLDNDGYLDLVIYDQIGAGRAGKVLCFLNNGQTINPYQYTAEYSTIFDTLVTASFITAKDINQDNIPDLITTLGNDFEGLLIYEGFYDKNNTYNFILRQEIYGYTLDDLRKPAVVDVDKDGFWDILKLNTADDGINFLRNLGRDTLAFEVEECWGNFIKFPLQNTIQLDTDCSHTPKTESTPPLHYFSALSAFDVDGDDDTDFFLSNSGSNYVNYIVNGGSPQQAQITAFQDSFPQTNPIQLYSTPYIQEIDLNNDTNKEWIITPQDPDNAATIQNVLVYEVNEKVKDQFPQITLQTNAFLVDQMIDVGAFSHPVFFDHNQDGLTDLLIGNYRSIDNYKTQTPSTLTLFENIGTPEAPTYKWITNDYLNLSEQRYFGAIPAFGDLDGDGDQDMVLTNLFENTLQYYQNTPTENGIAQFDLVNDKLITLGNYLDKSPFLADINQDGLLDFIIGIDQGNIHYYANIGSATLPAFELISENWGQVNTQTSTSITGSATPIINDWDNNDTLDLFLGNISGEITHYIVNPTDPEATFQKMPNPFPNVQTSIRTTLAMHDLNNDQRPEIIIGGFSGGLTLCSQSINTTHTNLSHNSYSHNQIKLYPNPTNHILHINMIDCTTNCKQIVQLFDYSGKKILNKQINQQDAISLLPFAKGIYFIKVGNTPTKKIIYY